MRELSINITRRTKCVVPIVTVCEYFGKKSKYHNHCSSTVEFETVQIILSLSTKCTAAPYLCV